MGRSHLLRDEVRTLSTAVWRKAARSSNNGGDCVEVARVGEVVAVRDSKDPDGPKLLLTPQALGRLSAAIKNA
ncbi:DUF397 domain-containing protein [Actinomadura luteofluorescens]|uniref:DUF397 domain-containing protein n=1 Tax=Actinomadura luteofluorescens TaxID=46163 RepID=A0A7Y9JIG7_9ACTN|nr:DUF397 domain-containing protein [Actinomadura luteofluorescens]NYD49806.1 hypothetical protein [Actinomadura luteofluorescens]